MNHVVRRSLVAVSAVILLLLAACTDASPPGDASPPSDPSPPGDASPPSDPSSAPAGTLRAAVEDWGNDTMAPWHGSGSHKLFASAMFEPLLGADDEGRLSKETGLARDWVVEGDTITLHLREGVMFHNGSEFTAEDAKFSIEISIETGINLSSGGLAAAIESIDVVDPHTLRLNLNEPNATILSLLRWHQGDVAMVPRAYVEEVGEDGFEAAPVGTGPYTFVSHVADTSVTVEANPDYWNKDSLAKFQTVTVFRITEPGTRNNLLRSGEMDLIQVAADQTESLIEDGFELHVVENIGNSLLMFHQCYDPAFITNDIRIRQALIQAIDVQSIVEAFYPAGTATIANGSAFFSPLTAGNDPELPPYPYDPEHARELLSDAGYAGENIEIQSFAIALVPSGPDQLIAIQEMWREVGVNSTINPVDVNTWRETWRARPQIFEPPAVVSLGAPNTESTGMFNWRIFMLGVDSGGLIALACDPEKYDPLYEELITVTDEDELHLRLQEVNRMWYEDYYGTPLVFVNGTWMSNSDTVADWTPIAGSPYLLNWNSAVPGPGIDQ